MPARPVAALVIGLVTLTGALSGCILERPDADDAAPDAPEVYMLDYTIIDLSPEEDGRYAAPGQHCADAAKDDDTLTISLWPEEEPPEGPWLAVFPEVPDHWPRSIDGEPFKTTFPTTVDPRVQDDPTTLGTLSWEPHGPEGTVRLDGDTISLPHHWNVHGQNDTWRAELTLSAWDDDVDIQRYSGYCD